MDNEVVAIFSQREFSGLSLSEQEIEFVHEFVTTGGSEPDMAAVAVGYSPKHGRVLVKKLHILEAIRRYVLMQFQVDAVRARKTLVDVMTDVRTPAMVQRQCAKDILEIANLTGGALVPAGSSGKMMDVSNLTEAEKDQLELLLAKTCSDPAGKSDNVIDVDFKETKHGQG